MDFILDLVLRDIIVITVNIITEGVRGATFQMISGNPSVIFFMGK